MPPQVDLYASREHYMHHLLPVWAELHVRGLAGQRWAPRTDSVTGAQRWGGPTGRLVLVASYVDAMKVAPAPVVVLEHGAGQTYPGDPLAAEHGSYSGGAGYPHARLFLCPSETVADRWRARYPEVPAVAVGCPKLDPWHRRDFPRADGPTTVGITWHYDEQLVPETRSAWMHYRAAMPSLVAAQQALGRRVVCSAHPRALSALGPLLAAAGAEVTPYLADLLNEADVLVADNTSALWEFASLDRPVVLLNAPWYRRDVNHGGRFWTWATAGPQADEPNQVGPAIDQALAGGWAARRRWVVRQVYAHTDGSATTRAADAIEEAARA